MQEQKKTITNARDAIRWPLAPPRPNQGVCPLAESPQLCVPALTTTYSDGVKSPVTWTRSCQPSLLTQQQQQYHDMPIEQVLWLLLSHATLCSFARHVRLTYLLLTGILQHGLQQHDLEGIVSAFSPIAVMGIRSLPDALHPGYRMELMTQLQVAGK